MDDKQYILKVAKEIRDFIEILVQDNDSIFSEDLCGACAIASHALYEVLRIFGHDPIFVVHFSEHFGGHCWVELNGMVIDITATQFDGPEVAYYPVSETPNWFPCDLTNDCIQRCNETCETGRYFRLEGKEALDFVQGWEEQSPLTYSSEIGNLQKMYQRQHQEEFQKIFDKTG